jgi:16S rRNA (cytosine967-C5)-methyltransferase
MRPNALLELTASLVQAVLRGDQSADRVVSAFLREHRALGPRERHTLAETTYAVLRRRLLLQHLAQSGHGPLERRLAVLGWQGSADFLRAALSPPEQSWLDQVSAVDPSQLPDRLRHNLPAWVADPLRAELGEEAFWALARALDAPAPLDLRVNVLKARREEAQAALQALGVACTPTPHSPWGLRLADKPALTKLAPFERGEVEVQDEGSQLLALLTGARRGEMVVDFCAGAGGKTLALKRLAGKADRVLVDAPCSGLGTLRRNPDLKWRQSPETVLSLQSQQRAILEAAARLLRPGGRLVYATCSLLRAENEEVATAFGAAHAQAFEPLPAAQALAEARVDGAEALADGPFLRLWPHRHRTDGFFAAAWIRRP